MSRTRQIHKHELMNVPGTQPISTYENAKFLTIGLDGGGRPAMWLDVDTAGERETINLVVVWTGMPTPDEASHRYLGTVADPAPALVVHYFEKI